MDEKEAEIQPIRTREDAAAAVRRYASGAFAKKRIRLEACEAGLLWISAFLFLAAFTALLLSMKGRAPKLGDLVYLLPVMLVVAIPNIMMVVSVRSVFRRLRDERLLLQKSDEELIRLANELRASDLQLQEPRGFTKQLLRSCGKTCLRFSVVFGIGLIFLAFTISLKK